MTTFEITIIVLLVAIVMLLIVLLRTAIKGFHDMCLKQEIILGDTMVIKAYFNNLLERCRTLQQQLNDIKDNILDDLRDIRIVDKLGNPSPNVPTPLPCYAPNGICTNPQKDCINCPKRGDGGTWSTNISIKAEDAPLQERFNDNKED